MGRSSRCVRGIMKTITQRGTLSVQLLETLFRMGLHTGLAIQARILEWLCSSANEQRLHLFLGMVLLGRPERGEEVEAQTNQRPSAAMRFLLRQ